MSNQYAVVKHPEGIVPEVASWIFVDSDTDSVYVIDAINGTWERTRRDEGTPCAGGTIDRELAEAICRAAYESHHPNPTEH